MVRRVFGVAEFRYLWTAELLSLVGDQLARVALAVLIFGRTGSAAWAALTYALTFLPALAGGVLLGRLADRHRRRELMVLADLARTALVGVMALPALPLWLVGALLVPVVLLAAPHTAAQGALLPEVLGERYEEGLAVRQITGQAAQLAGFGFGGAVLLVLSPSAVLALNAVSFGLSAALVRFGVRDRPAPVGRGAPGDDRPDWFAETRAGLVAVGNHRARRLLAALVWLVGCYVVPEGLAAPYAADLGAGPAAVGLLMAADPAGSVLGAWLFARYVPASVRPRLIGLCAIGGGLALVGCAARPGVVGSTLLWALSGAFSSACLVQAQASFVRATPDALRGRAIGVAASGLIAAQGAAILIAGLFADRLGTPETVGATGALGAIGAGVLALRWRRAAAEVPGAGPDGVPVSSG